MSEQTMSFVFFLLAIGIGALSLGVWYLNRDFKNLILSYIELSRAIDKLEDKVKKYSLDRYSNSNS